VTQTTVHHIAMMEQKRKQVIDRSHDRNGEESMASDVDSDDEIFTQRSAIRRARGLSSAEPPTERSEVRVTGQDGVIEVVDVNSGNTRTSPRFHIGSTEALPE
jgi:hypothetical protein